MASTCLTVWWLDRAVEALPADRGDLAQAEGGYSAFSSTIACRIPTAGPAGDPARRRRFVEETAHAGRREAGDLAAQGALGHAGLAGAGAGRLPEEHDRPQQFVGFLLGRGDEEAQLSQSSVGSRRGRGPAGMDHPQAKRERAARGCALLSRRCRLSTGSGQRCCPPVSTT